MYGYSVFVPDRVMNTLRLQSPIVAHLYRSRWEVELFLKGWRSVLRIKAFYGTCESPGTTRICIAPSVYAIVAIVQKHVALGLRLHKLQRVFHLASLEKTPISLVVPNVGSNFPDINPGTSLTPFTS